MSRYRHPAMKQLADQQTRFASQEQKARQLARAESLAAELEPARLYPYQYVCFRITEFRPDAYPDLVVKGDDLRHDLLLFLDDLAESAPLPMSAAAEPVFTLEELSKQYSISTKTVSRWRAKGLVSRRFLVDGRKRVGFLKSSVDRFVGAHATEVARGVRFTQLTDLERDEIVAMARAYSQAPAATLAEVARRVARQIGRSPETVRYTIKNHDRLHPQSAIFPDLRGPLDEPTKLAIFNKAAEKRMTVDELAKRYGRTRTSVYRVVNEMRAKRLLAEPLDCMHHPSFEKPGAEAAIVAAEEPVPPKKGAQPKAPAGLPPYLQSLYEVPLLTREQEQYLFRKMNFLLWKACKLREAIDPASVKAGDLDQIEKWVEDATEIKRRLVRANLRLVVSIAKRHISTSLNLFELISDGNVSLMRAVEKFDFGRGFKFSTYASWAIMKNFARSIPQENTRRDRFVTGQELAFELAADARTNEVERERSAAKVHSVVEGLLEQLEDREREVIMDRYGLRTQRDGATLEEVGSKWGVTKERIRQIEARAIRKLRRMAQEAHLELPEIG